MYAHDSIAHAILVAMISRNANSVGTRAVGTALYNMAYQFGSIAAANIYRNDDKPYCMMLCFDILLRDANTDADYNGNKILLGICCANIVLFGVTKVYYIQRNKSKAKAWNKLSEDEKAHYIATTKDTGMRKLNVVFAH